MPNPIMIPLDGSRFSEHALPVAAQIARRTGAPLHIVQVHEAAPALAPPAGAPLVDVRGDAALRVQEQEYLQAVAARCAEREGVTPRTVLLDGPVSAALAAYAAALDAELIVMTTHGRGGISRAWVGSVADALVRRITVPVLLIRSQSEKVSWQESPIRRVLIPLDGSARSAAVIEPAIALGQLTGAAYTLLRIVLPLPFGGAAAGLTELAAGDAGAEAAAYLDAVAAPLRERGVDVATATLVSPLPAAAILDYAARHDSDCIAMATHGRTGWSRLALGSVADRVMRGTQLPVLLYRATHAGRAAGRPSEVAASIAE